MEASAAGLADDAREAFATACWLATAARVALHTEPLGGVEHPSFNSRYRESANEIAWMRRISSTYA
ncbi:hypothetical protein G5C65_13740 [Streptomyces sp. SB3404]|uniref:DUF6545 domain-containing protein n=1 Tax=Streptomyces boncukensis TaxID=2711219 RepID=A0A6G4WVT5_9ACTN|nr:hypothetical protein [Streptomyces boncukensis]NGO69396.1 hypothetical protein [Streptomyces boncukensis]